MSTKPAPSSGGNMKRSNIFLPQSMKDGLRQLAAKKGKGCTSADLVRQAVGGLLKRNGIEH